MQTNMQRGECDPIGATIKPGGVNFCLYSRNAISVDLLLFEHENDSQPAYVIPFDPIQNRTYHYWHAFVPGVNSGQLYAYRVSGLHAPQQGLRFDSSNVLLDPYGRGVVMPSVGTVSTHHKEVAAWKSIVTDTSKYDWEGDSPLHRPSARTVIYEMHVAGFTRNPNSTVNAGSRGTYAGVIDKIPYLQDLGVTAVELLPVFQFDAHACPSGLVNYWGYQPVSFFAPHRAYSSRQNLFGPLDEFRDMVKALHRAGIEVILDVVFNHTAEGGPAGKTFSFRGIDNSTYYILDSTNRANYSDYSGCGNTLNANHPVVRRMIVDCIHYWVKEMHVDGFRFDLASILSRDVTGQVLPNPPILWDLETDPVLAGTKLIAEAWDAAGLYQVGHFIGDSWKEWNGRFRDDVRSFFRGDSGTVRNFADRLIGSPEIYGHKQREPEQSINFITCHDGFTLNDLVCFNTKHNDQYAESNRDGSDDNRSWNCGVEGPTDNVAIERLRNRHVKNLFAVTLLSLGVPMIQMGDEIRRSQHGNNNNYCHDDESNWLNWELLGQHGDVHRFVKLLISRRLLRSTTHEEQRISLSQLIANAKKEWHGVHLHQPDWNHHSHSVALLIELKEESQLVYMIFNAYHEPLSFDLPMTYGDQQVHWRRWIDTSLPSPEDIVPWELATSVNQKLYHVGPSTVVVLSALLRGSSTLSNAKEVSTIPD